MPSDDKSAGYRVPDGYRELRYEEIICAGDMCWVDHCAGDVRWVDHRFCIAPNDSVGQRYRPYEHFNGRYRKLLVNMPKECEE